MWKLISNYLKGIRQTFTLATKKVYGDITFSTKGNLMYILENNNNGAAYGKIKVYKTQRPFVAEKSKFIYEWSVGNQSYLWKANYDGYRKVKLQFNDDGSVMYLLDLHQTRFVNGTRNQFRKYYAPNIRQYTLSTPWDLRTYVNVQKQLDRTSFHRDTAADNSFGDREHRIIHNFQIVNDGKTLLLIATRGRYIEDNAMTATGAAAVDTMVNNSADAGRAGKVAEVPQGKYYNLATTSSGSGTGATLFVKVKNDGSVGTSIAGNDPDYGLMNPGTGYANNEVLTLVDDLGHSSNTKLTFEVNGLVTDNSIYRDKVKGPSGNNGLYSEIYQMSLTTPWDITTAIAIPGTAGSLFNNLVTHVFSGSSSVVSNSTDGHNSSIHSTARAAIEKIAIDLTFNNDGTEMYVLSADSKSYSPNGGKSQIIANNISGFDQHISRYQLSTAFDINTASYLENVRIDTVEVSTAFEKSQKNKLQVIGLNGVLPTWNRDDAIFKIFEIKAAFGSVSTKNLNTYDMSSNPNFDSDLAEISFNSIVVESTSFRGYKVIGLIPFKQEDGSIYYAILVNGSAEFQIGTMNTGHPYLSQEHELEIINAWKTVFVHNKDKPSNEKKKMIAGYMQNSAFNSSGEMLRYLQYWHENPGMVARPTSSR